MKKKLNLQELTVTSFEVSDRGGVVAMDVSEQTACLCTRQEGCYPSQYCSLYGPYQLTCAPDCMTNERGLC